MDFREVINLLKKYFTFIDFENYDGIIIKKLSSTNTISGTEDSHQSHIAITGKQMDFFPFLAAEGYFNVPYENKADDLKKFFTLQIPINIYRQNYEYLKRESNVEIIFSEDLKKTYTSVVRSRRESGGDQIELSIKSLDGTDFIEYRKLYTTDDFLILLKRKSILEYDLLGLRKDIEDAAELSKLNDFYRENKTITKVSADLFEQNIDEPNLSRNRIIFGAPGTGKSNKIIDDARIDKKNNKSNIFKYYERVTFHPNYSYAQFVGTYKPVMNTSANPEISETSREIISILNSNKSAQTKYDELRKYFNENDRNFCSISTLLGILTDEDFSTINKEGTKEVGLSAYVNVGKALRDVVRIKDVNKASEITYSYVPGPFVRVLEKALYSKQEGTNEPYLLIIEEINRANVAAVFGDVFQLLDRNEHNESQYEIDMSEDLYNYLTSENNEQIGHKKIKKIDKKLAIPSNMYIWATMNSADQGVFPMDAAFKRRWNFEYLSIDNGDDKVKDYVVKGANKDYNWNNLRKAINKTLKDKVDWINEDKLLGPWFIKPDDKDGKTISADAFCNKVLMYLYEDVVKIQPDVLFKKSENSNALFYSDIKTKWEKDDIAAFVSTVKDEYYKLMPGNPKDGESGDVNAGAER